MTILKNLLSTAFYYGKKFGQLTLISQLATVGILMVSTYYFATCGKDQELQKINVVVEQTKQYANRIKDSVQTLQDSVNTTQVTVNKLTFEISVLKTKRVALVKDQSRLEVLRQVEKDTTIIVALQDTTITNLKNQLTIADSTIQTQENIISNKTQQIALLQSSLRLSEIRGDTLQKTLDYTLNKINKKDKVLGIIPMPTRKVVAAAVFIGGAYVGAKIAK